MSTDLFPTGAPVLEAEDPNAPEDCHGIVVEPTADELAEGEGELCGFETGEYRLVEWRWEDEPGEVSGREWYHIDDLRADQNPLVTA